MTGTTDDQGRPLRLLAAVAAQHGADRRPDLIEATRALIEDVVGPALGVDLTWNTTVVRRSDDLERGTVPEVAGLAWSLANAADAELEAVYLGGKRASVGPPPAGPDPRPDPRAEPVHALLRFPDIPAGAATVACSVQLGVLPGGRISTDLAQTTQRWLAAASEATGAETGYVAVDVADAYDASSSWELAVGAAPSARDVTRTVWGYGWCTLLSPGHVMRLGGTERLAPVPGAVVLIGPDNRILVRLGEDPAAVTAEQRAALREALRPVLPSGDRSLADYRALISSDPYVVSPDYLL